LNDSCAGAMRPFVKLLWPLVIHTPHMPISKVWIYRLLFVFFVCTVTDFFAKDKASGVNFAGRFIGRESPILGDFAPPEAQNGTSRPARRPRHGCPSARTCAVQPWHGPRVGSACVDIRPSLKTDVYFLLLLMRRLY